jgi:hypothetical protein
MDEKDLEALAGELFVEVHHRLGHGGRVLEDGSPQGCPGYATAADLATGHPMRRAVWVEVARALAEGFTPVGVTRRRDDRDVVAGQADPKDAHESPL